MGPQAGTPHLPSVQKPCQQCGELFKASVSVIRRGNDRFCSIKCVRLQRYGEATPKDRLLYYTNVPEDPNACWIWQAHKNPAGYGDFYIEDVRYSAHRTSYEVFNGPIPKGVHVLHRCDNPSCVSPRHLFLGDAKVNSDDKRKKWRHIYGKKQWRAKLTDEKVRQIRELAKQGVHVNEIAMRFGMTQAPIRDVICRRSWKHVH